MAKDAVMYSDCCYICKNRSFLVTNFRCRCELDKNYRAAFGICDKFSTTDDKEVLAAAKLVTTPSEKWYL